MHADELDLNLLSVFDAMLRERSVTKAAQELGLTQSAMSHALNRLRAFFDDQLFVKTPEGMMPTHKAEELTEAIVGVMATVRQQVLSQARFDPLAARRTFNLCMTDMGELVFLPPLISRLRREAPHCTLRTLQVPLQQIEGLLGSGEADLALGSIRAAPEGLFQQRLFMHSFVTIVSARNREIGEALTLEQFQRMPQIVVTLSGRASAAYDSAFDDHGIKRNIYLSTPHFLVVPLLIEQHPDLIATVPLELANVFARYGTVRVMQPPVALPKFAIKQHWHPRFHHDPAIIWLRELVKRTFEHYPKVFVGEDEPAASPPPPVKRSRRVAKEK
ncbi:MULTISPECIES: LysR family transcriptional regulator [Cupriavidus]|uniref:LysR family transcriptional regulator n=1 Tax=Cupriavidus TaxID=106589 RepID=UPI000450C411|nr:LysR family transcriptional regulator [Cupriavidus basilensis]MDF3888659.1 LysR family transcriptional regulator [Cupriavidus basilensis]